MIFYNYKIGNDEFCLTEEEHKIVISEMKKGASIIPLRERTLIINTAYLKSCEIDQESVNQDRAEKAVKLSSGKGERTDYFQKPSKEALEKVKKIRLDLCEKMGWPIDWAKKEV